VADEESDGGELRISRLRPRLSLQAGETLATKYVGFPIARVTLFEEAYTLTNFVPPQLAVTRMSVLGEMCQTLATRLREKAVFLAERVRTPLGQSDKPLLQQTQTAIHGLGGRPAGAGSPVEDRSRVIRSRSTWRSVRSRVI
jgi:type VI secretion system protein ImpJ